MKRDLHTWRLTQIAAWIVQRAVSSRDCKHCSCAWICLSFSCPLSFSTRICSLYNVWVLLDGSGRGGGVNLPLNFVHDRQDTHTHTCMYACMHAHMHACTHARMHAHECTNSTNNTHYISSMHNKRTHTHTHTHTHALLLTLTHTHVHTPPAHGWDINIGMVYIGHRYIYIMEYKYKMRYVYIHGIDIQMTYMYIMKYKYQWDICTYSLLHLNCHLTSISNLNLIGLFSTERGERDLKN